MQQLAVVRDGDPPLTDVEGAILERLLTLAGDIADKEVDMEKWFALVRSTARRDDHARITEILDACGPVDRVAAVAIFRLTADERDVLGVLIERHPHTYFDGFHEQAHLRRAHELAMIGVRSGICGLLG
jgi:hypothetical protein